MGQILGNVENMTGDKHKVLSGILDTFVDQMKGSCPGYTPAEIKVGLIREIEDGRVVIVHDKEKGELRLEEAT